MTRETYISVNGYRMRKSTGELVKLPKEILQLFHCIFTHDTMIIPAYVPETQQIYDLNQLKQWFLISDNDPLTGLQLPRSINFIPVFNYFIFLLCLELQDDQVIYHPPPKGELRFLHQLFDLIVEQRPILKNNDNFQTIFSCSSYPDHLIYLSDNLSLDDISLNVEDYYMEISLLPKRLADRISKPIEPISQYTLETLVTKPPAQYLSIEELLLYCPISGRLMYQNCCINSQGILVHKKYREYSRSLFGNYPANTKSFAFRNDTLIPFSANPLFEFLAFDFVEEDFSFGEVELKILQTVPLSQLRKLTVIDPRYHQVWVQSEGFEIPNTIFPSDQVDALPDISSVWDDEKVEKVYKRYLSLQHYHVSPEIAKLNKLNYGLISYQGSDTIKFKLTYKIPLFYRFSDGDDHSFTRIKNKNLVSECLTFHYFIGCRFKKVEFDDCLFRKCVFIASDFDGCIFVNCRFEKCIFYRNKNSQLVRSYSNTFS